MNHPLHHLYARNKDVNWQFLRTHTNNKGPYPPTLAQSRRVAINGYTTAAISRARKQVCDAVDRKYAIKRQCEYSISFFDDSDKSAAPPLSSKNWGKRGTRRETMETAEGRNSLVSKRKMSTIFSQ